MIEDPANVAPRLMRPQVAAVQVRGKPVQDHIERLDALLCGSGDLPASHNGMVGNPRVGLAGRRNRDLLGAPLAHLPAKALTKHSKAHVRPCATHTRMAHPSPCSKPTRLGRLAD